jgi:transposase InsO family protein
MPPNLSSFGRKLIRQAREAPARAVNKSGSHLTYRYPSKKMGMTMDLESTLELAAFLPLDNSSSVGEIYTQPFTVTLRTETETESDVWHYTPDIYYEAEGIAHIVEVKPRSKLFSLAEQHPQRYACDSNGKIHCPPMEAFADEHGFVFSIVTDDEINQIQLENLLFLDHFIREIEVPPYAPELEKIKAYLEEKNFRRLSELLAVYNPDTIYKATVRKDIFIDLETDRLSDPQTVHVFADEIYYDLYHLAAAKTRFQTDSFIHLKTGTKLSINQVNFSIKLIAGGEIFLEDSENNLTSLKTENFNLLRKTGKVAVVDNQTDRQDNLNENLVDLIAQADEPQIRKILERAEVISFYVNNGSYPDDLAGMSKRNIRRLAKAWRKKEVEYGHGIFALFPKGRREQSKRVDDSVEALFWDCLEKFYFIPERPLKSTLIKIFRQECREKELNPAAPSTCYRWLNEIDEVKAKLSREGFKAAYQISPRSDPKDKLSTPSFPFQIAMIDHTQCDLELFDSQTGEELGKATLTIMLDLRTRLILAVHLSFEDDSHRSLMCLLRECHRRFGMLPEMISVDNGADFNSVYFEMFLAMFKVTKISHPVARSRFGGEVESGIKTINNQFLYFLRGNTQNSKKPRTNSPSHDPKRLSVWSLPDVYPFLQEFCYEIYPNQHHTGIEEKPLQRFEREIKRSGIRSSRLISDDFLFFFMSLPQPARKQPRKIFPNAGIKVNGIHYWNPIFRVCRDDKVMVRWDPYNIGHVYAVVDGEVKECQSKLYHELQHLTHIEHKLISEEIKIRKRQTGQKIDMCAENLVKFWKKVKGREDILLQHKRSLENQRILPHLSEHVEIVDENEDFPFEQRDEVNPITEARNPIILEEF